MNISVDDKLQVLFDSWEMKDFSYFFISRSENYANKLARMTLTEIQEEAPDWNTEGAVYGLNHMLDLIHNGIKIDYDFYTEEEMQQDATKRNTKLFYFPAEGGENKPTIYLCAGGGYTAVCNMMESFPVASKLNELGYNAIVISYRTAKPALEVDIDLAKSNALEDIAAAMKYVKDNSQLFQVADSDYAICGFSAGAFISAEWGIEEKGYGKYHLNKPISVLLCYGYLNDVSELTEQYPATFYCYCEDDSVIEIGKITEMEQKENSLGIMTEKIVGKMGGHGFGLGLGTETDGWVEMVIGFIEKQR